MATLPRRSIQKNDRQFITFSDVGIPYLQATIFSTICPPSRVRMGRMFINIRRKLLRIKMLLSSPLKNSRDMIKSKKLTNIPAPVIMISVLYDVTVDCFLMSIPKGRMVISCMFIPDSFIAIICPASCIRAQKKGTSVYGLKFRSKKAAKKMKVGNPIFIFVGLPISYHRHKYDDAQHINDYFSDTDHILSLLVVENVCKIYSYSTCPMSTKEFF